MEKVGKSSYLNRVNIMMRRWRYKSDARLGCTKPCNVIRNLWTRKLTTFARFCTFKVLCDELDDIKTTEVITMQWISAAVEWIDSLSSLMVFGEKAKLELSLENAEDLAISGASVLLGVEDLVKKSILRHKISLYTNEKTRNFSVKIARGGTTHSMGAYVLRWIEACFNGLRGDIYATYEFSRSVEEFSTELDDSSNPTIASLSEMRENLFVTPTKEVIQSFAELKTSFGSQTGMEKGITNTNIDAVPHFNHRLLFENAMTKK